uniref:Cytochrome c oxidase subunit 2 n=1 Tax=Schimmelmannia schousboei TaxID=173468 RepID=A0A0E3DAY8_9FLOR|nr:cytochrome c oxidase subunit 2 [Schimmelmannia schousboei]
MNSILNKINYLWIYFMFMFLYPSVVFSDIAENWQLGFQDPATPIMEGIINLHHDLMFFICIISVFVSWMLGRTLWHFEYKQNSIPSSLTHGTLIEIVWTVTPAIILLIIAIPSFSLLYAMDEIISPAITIKTLGHQWYWSYEYSDYLDENNEALLYDSYMIPEEDLELGQFRLLEVDNRIVVPVNTHIRIIVSAADVLHSWAVPSLGIKCDAIPGRLNQTSLFVKREGVYYGQCSEICGINHGFMPIVVEAVSLPNYISWIANKLSE